MWTKWYVLKYTENPFPGAKAYCGVWIGLDLTTSKTEGGDRKR